MSVVMPPFMSVRVGMIYLDMLNRTAAQPANYSTHTDKDEHPPASQPCRASIPDHRIDHVSPENQKGGPDHALHHRVDRYGEPGAEHDGGNSEDEQNQSVAADVDGSQDQRATA
jgi:hypothetical protein